MFGFTATPAPPFSETTPEPEEKVIDVKIMAVRPADLSDLPAELLANLSPLDPGWVSDDCDSCGCPVHVGPRQFHEYMSAPSSDSYLMLCFKCTAIFAVQAGVDTSAMDIRHLGGK